MDKTDWLLEQLACSIEQRHSFDYSTLTEARINTNIGKYYYSYDALSLLPYEHNLSQEELVQLRKLMDGFYRSIRLKDPNHYKELIERRILFWFLTGDNNPYLEFKIKKCDRPDFILDNNEQRVGIEVTRLTTESDENLLAIVRETAGKKMNAKGIKDYALKKHRTFAASFDYYDFSGSTAIGTKTFSVRTKQSVFADLLMKKYYKYRKEMQEYECFIILGDATTNSVVINKEDDADSVIDLVMEKCPEIDEVTIVIVWESDSQKKLSWYSF